MSTPHSDTNQTPVRLQRDSLVAGKALKCQETNSSQQKIRIQVFEARCSIAKWALCGLRRPPGALESRQRGLGCPALPSSPGRRGSVWDEEGQGGW